MLKLFNFLKYQNRSIIYITREYGAAIQSNIVENEKWAHSNLQQYFEKYGISDIVKHAPKHYLRRLRSAEYYTVVNPQLAKKIAFAICSRMDEGLVMESDPGFGFMSEILVTEAPHLCLCEKSPEFRSKLAKLEEDHENVRIFDFNVKHLVGMIFCIQETPLPKVTYLYQFISEKIEQFDLNKINWIFTASRLRFIQSLCKLNLCDFSFQQLGKMEYYITLPSTVYEKITTSPDGFHERNATTAVLFQLLFDYEILLKGIPRKMFLPWPGLKDDSNEELRLIRIVLKAEILNILNSAELRASFIKFLQIGLRKQRRVIPVLESYINNCGPIFILEHDLTVYTEFLELTPKQLLSIFLSFSNLPEFSHSSFVEYELEELLLNEKDEINLENEDQDDEMIDEDETDPVNNEEISENENKTGL